MRSKQKRKTSDFVLRSLRLSHNIFITSQIIHCDTSTRFNVHLITFFTFCGGVQKAATYVKSYKSCPNIGISRGERSINFIWKKKKIFHQKSSFHLSRLKNSDDDYWLHFPLFFSAKKHISQFLVVVWKFISSTPWGHQLDKPKVLL